MLQNASQVFRSHSQGKKARVTLKSTKRSENTSRFWKPFKMQAQNGQICFGQPLKKIKERKISKTKQRLSKDKQEKH